MNVCKQFITRDSGVILKLHVSSAKDVRLLSFIPLEGELLIGPNTVARASEKVMIEDGWPVLRMVQDADEAFKFYS